jgi:hypothetical protein
MTKPTPPLTKSPLKAFTMFPKTSVAMMTIASRHPQMRSLNQPVPATAKTAPSKKRGIPTVFPKGASYLYAGKFIVHMRSRTVPRQTSVVPARHAMIAPKNKKIPTAMIPLANFV